MPVPACFVVLALPLSETISLICLFFSFPLPGPSEHKFWGHRPTLAHPTLFQVSGKGLTGRWSWATTEEWVEKAETASPKTHLSHVTTLPGPVYP